MTSRRGLLVPGLVAEISAGRAVDPGGIFHHPPRVQAAAPGPAAGTYPLRGGAGLSKQARTTGRVRLRA